MMRSPHRPIMLTLLSAMLPLSCLASASEPDELRYNPFLWPDVASSPETTAAPDNLPGQTLPTVRAAMVSGDFSMANVEGKMLREGDTINGYELIEIHQQYVVFQKNNIHYPVPIYENGKKSDQDD